MHGKVRLTVPLIEIGFKAYMYGETALKLAKVADNISADYDVPIIITPQCVDIPKIVNETKNILVFAQHCDSLEIGRGTGSILLEAVKEACAVGTALNHSEKSLTLTEINKIVKRAKKVGLATMVYADSPEEAVGVAHLHPDIISPEPPELISTDVSVGRYDTDFVTDSMKRIKEVDPNIITLFGAGIRSGEDIGRIVRLGGRAVGSASGVVFADSPAGMIEEMVAALKKTFDEVYN